MKRKDIIDLIIAHYEDNPRRFFQKTIDILKEFKEDGADEFLINHLSAFLKSQVKIAPKRAVTMPKDIQEEVSFEDAAALDWVPMHGSHNTEGEEHD